VIHHDCFAELQWVFLVPNADGGWVYERKKREIGKLLATVTI
jgi:hypothetical protein